MTTLTTVKPTQLETKIYDAGVEIKMIWDLELDQRRKAWAWLSKEIKEQFNREFVAFNAMTWHRYKGYNLLNIYLNNWKMGAYVTSSTCYKRVNADDSVGYQKWKSKKHFLIDIKGTKGQRTSIVMPVFENEGSKTGLHTWKKKLRYFKRAGMVIHIENVKPIENNLEYFDTLRDAIPTEYKETVSHKIEHKTKSKPAVKKDVFSNLPF